MTAWTDFATKTYKEEKAKNPDFTFGMALKKAGKMYKKGGQVGGDPKFDINGNKGDGDEFIYESIEQAASAKDAAAAAKTLDETDAAVDETAVDSNLVVQNATYGQSASPPDAKIGGKKRRTKKGGRKSTKKGGRKSQKKGGRKSAKK